MGFNFKKYLTYFLISIIIIGVSGYFYYSNKNTDKSKSQLIEYSDVNKKKSNTINKLVSNEFDNYINDMELMTKRKIPKKQIDILRSYINNSKIYKLGFDDIKIHRKDFDSKRKDLIKEWEKNIGEKWPKYNKEVIINNKVVRKKGNNYDAHHIIELSWNGANEWWNLTPAAFPDEHQNGIHRKDGVAAKIFGEIPDYVNSK